MELRAPVGEAGNRAVAATAARMQIENLKVTRTAPFRGVVRVTNPAFGETLRQRCGPGGTSRRTRLACAPPLPGSISTMSAAAGANAGRIAYVTRARPMLLPPL